MSTLVIILLIGVVSGIISIISSSSKLFDKRSRPFYKIPTRSGWVFIAFTFVLTALPFIQKIYEEREDKEKDRLLKIDQHRRDSTAQARYDSSLRVMQDSFNLKNHNLTMAITKTLGESNLAFDSAKQQIVKLVRDSSKTRIFEAENPVLHLINESGFVDKTISPPHYKFEVKIESSDASSCDFDIMSYIIVTDSIFSYFEYKGGSPVIEPQVVMAKNESIHPTFSFIASKPADLLFYYLKGTYKNTQRTKTFTIDNVYYYNIHGKTQGVLLGNTRKKALQAITDPL